MLLLVCLLVILVVSFRVYENSLIAVFNLKWGGTSMDLFRKKEINLNHTSEMKKN